MISNYSKLISIFNKNIPTIYNNNLYTQLDDTIFKTDLYTFISVPFLSNCKYFIISDGVFYFCDCDIYKMFVIDNGDIFISGDKGDITKEGNKDDITKDGNKGDITKEGITKGGNNKDGNTNITKDYNNTNATKDDNKDLTNKKIIYKGRGDEIKSFFLYKNKFLIIYTTGDIYLNDEFVYKTKSDKINLDGDLLTINEDEEVIKIDLKTFEKGREGFVGDVNSKYFKGDVNKEGGTIRYDATNIANTTREDTTNIANTNMINTNIANTNNRTNKPDTTTFPQHKDNIIKINDKFIFGDLSNILEIKQYKNLLLVSIDNKLIYTEHSGSNILSVLNILSGSNILVGKYVEDHEDTILSVSVYGDKLLTTGKDGQSILYEISSGELELECSKEKSNEESNEEFDGREYSKEFDKTNSMESDEESDESEGRECSKEESNSMDSDEESNEMVSVKSQKSKIPHKNLDILEKDAPQQLNKVQKSSKDNNFNKVQKSINNNPSNKIQKSINNKPSNKIQKSINNKPSIKNNIKKIKTFTTGIMNSTDILKDISIMVGDDGILNFLNLNTLELNLQKISDKDLNTVKIYKKSIFIGGNDKLLRIFDFNLNLIHTINDHKKPIMCVSTGYKYFCSCSSDKTIRVYDYSYLCVSVLSGYDSGILYCKFVDNISLRGDGGGRGDGLYGGDGTGLGGGSSGGTSGGTSGDDGTGLDRDNLDRGNLDGGLDGGDGTGLDGVSLMNGSPADERVLNIENRIGDVDDNETKRTEELKSIESRYTTNHTSTYNTSTYNTSTYSTYSPSTYNTNKLISSGVGGIIKIWDFKKGLCLDTLETGNDIWSFECTNDLLTINTDRSLVTYKYGKQDNKNKIYLKNKEYEKIETDNKNLIYLILKEILCGEKGLKEILCGEKGLKEILCGEIQGGVEEDLKVVVEEGSIGNEDISKKGIGKEDGVKDGNGCIKEDISNEDGVKEDIGNEKSNKNNTSSNKNIKNNKPYTILKKYKNLLYETLTDCGRIKDIELISYIVDWCIRNKMYDKKIISKLSKWFERVDEMYGDIVGMEIGLN